MERSSSLKTISLSPSIDLYLVKVSYVSSHLANRKCSPSSRAELEKEDPGFLFALVLNFLPTLGAMTKDRKKRKNKNQGQIALRRVRDKIACNLKNYMMHDI